MLLENRKIFREIGGSLYIIRPGVCIFIFSSRPSDTSHHIVVSTRQQCDVCSIITSYRVDMQKLKINDIWYAGV